MTAAVILAGQIIAALPSITVGVESLIAWVNSIREAAQQTGEWTAAVEAQYQESLLTSAKDPANQQDAK